MATSYDTSSVYQIRMLYSVMTLMTLSIFIGFAETQPTNDNVGAESELPNAQMPEIKPSSPEDIFKDKNFYSFSVEDHNGETVSLDKYNNKVTLVVNVASRCGFTDSHYKALIRIRNILGLSEKFEVLAFPCNQFGAQEPEDNPDIQKFVHDIYHVNFPVFGKINVIEENVPEAFQYLVASSGSAPTWNFWKYLVNEKGHVVRAWGPQISVEQIFHEVKEVVDNIGFEQPSYQKRHPRSEGEL